MPENGLLYLKPENLTFEESACIVNGSLSAMVYLMKKGKIKNGDKVLINGASGSVGTAAVQLAKYFGAIITGVCSTKNVEFVKSIGADDVIDYTKQDFTQSDEKYDLIFDTIGKTFMKKCLNLLKPKVKYMLTEFGLTHILAAIFTFLFKNRKIIVASSNFYWKKEDLIFLKEIAEKGYLKPVVDKSFPLEKIVDAHKYVELGHKVGNVAISVK